MNDSLNTLKERIQDLPFSLDIAYKGGTIYGVGGSVRDAFLNLKSKDLDIMITGVEHDTLIGILKKYGTLDIVGESFGIIKFREFGSDEEIDISLPRIESPTGDRGHKSFTVTTNPYLPIEVDLERRDIKINAMALRIDGLLIDPFGGLNDIENKEINIVDENTFLDDPLRMLRVVVFASRLNFNVPEKTLNLIIANAHRIKEISPERIIIELRKIVDKGIPLVGAHFLDKTGLFRQIFNRELYYEFDEMDKVKTLGEFIHVMIGKYTDAAEFYKNELNGDIETTKELKALNLLDNTKFFSGHNMIAENIFKALNVYPKVIDTTLFNDSPHFTFAMGCFLNGDIPKSYKELLIDGYELMEFGYQGKEIRIIQDKLLHEMFCGYMKNNKEEILTYLKECQHVL